MASYLQWHGTRPVDRGLVGRLKLPRDLIEAVHADKRRLIDIFYPGQYSSLLQAACDRYGHSP